MFDEISDIIESFELEIEDGGPDASNICVPIDDVKKLMSAYAESRVAGERTANKLLQSQLDIIEANNRVKKLEVAKESLQEIMGYSGGADSALDDEYVMDRAESALGDCE